MSHRAHRVRRAIFRGVAGVVLPVSLAVLACNGILGNDPAYLVVDGGADASAPPPDADAGTCAAGTKLCFGACVPGDDWAFGCADASTCAACSAPHARPQQACAGGKCAFACEPGYADCNHDPGDGCETDITRAETCGSCDQHCEDEAGFCVLTGGNYTCLAACPAPFRKCGTECVDVTTNNASCGGCGNACDGGTACVDGGCAASCPDGYHLCGDHCASDTDPQQCGDLCATCPGGSLGNHVVPACANGACSYACAAGYADCDQNPVNGCEALLQDDKHCGACNGPHCTGGTHCCGSPLACSARCPP